MRINGAGDKKGCIDPEAVFAPLGIKLILEKEHPLQSNRIWLNSRLVGDWIGVGLKDQNMPQAVHNNAPRHSVQMFQIQLTTEMKDRIDVQGISYQPMYLQDDLQREQNFK
ncbi:MAG TPA: hypothetical protein VFG90_00765 [Nitrososphaeraceae archaeon]|nr:hypothetical protein [Nitrososphaeraceae archaeon]